MNHRQLTALQMGVQASTLAMRPLALTEWFDGSVAPARVGVYVRRTDLGIFYSYWDGSHWCRNARLSKGPAQAFKNAIKLGRSSRDTLAWCGVLGVTR